jgi:integrase
VELSKETNDMLREFAKSHKLGDFLFHAKSGKPLDDAYVRRDVLTPLGIDGAHNLRRFRTTRLRDEILVPKSILRGWIGHAVVGVSEKYSKPSHALRRQWCERAGTGLGLKQIFESI